MTEARVIRVRGQVQGVGFRPFVWQLAQRMELSGEVLNDPEGVLIHACGARLDAFEAALRAEAPLLSRVDSVESASFRFGAAPKGFSIAQSQGHGSDTGITPDAATCPACLAEIRDPRARRFGYAFTNCTHCGPRFTIVNALPYDRANTAMAAFTMCATCRAEYEDPADRRYHAQPIACPDCGPVLWLEDREGQVDGAPIAEAAHRLRRGETLAIKGLGGFHLACDARNAAALDRLRARKRRPAKPFALMGTLPMIATHSALTTPETRLLCDPAAPIVLLAKAGVALPEAVAPGQPLLGWMLPYAPLHHLLLDAFGGPLVMTSGNLSGEPQVIDNDTARSKLIAFADAVLMHDRPISRRLDDGVERIVPSGPMVLRRGRGRVPATLPLPPGFEAAPAVHAYGGQMKSAICLLKHGRALLSHHLGDLDDARTWQEYLAAESDYAQLFDHRPEILVCDLHSGFRASLRAAERATADGLPLLPVQHHHAHLASALGDAMWSRTGGPVAGVVLDGLGLGTDGTIWGGEVLLGDYRDVERVAHLVPAPLPGGDAANREPWRNLLARLDASGLEVWSDRLLADRPRAALRQAMAKGINSPLSSSAGRLFDAVAAAVGLTRDAQSFEGEAAMALEALAADQTAPPYPFARNGPLIDPAPMLRAMVDDLDAQRPAAFIAARFHAGLARAFCAPARALVEQGRARAVALSGGCFQNATLLAHCLRELHGVSVLLHHAVPANDGGLAFGQALVAAARAIDASTGAVTVAAAPGMIGSVAITVRVGDTGCHATIDPGHASAVEAFLIGRTPEEVAQILPRLFNLCRAAQSAAAHLALGLPNPEPPETLHREVLRDHMLKLFVVWPQLLHLPLRPFPPKDQIAFALFGPTGCLPTTIADFMSWQASEAGVAPLLRAIAASFAPGEAIADLSWVTPKLALQPSAQENSPALRHPGHSLLEAVKAKHGPGPLWRAVARLVDAEACLDRTLSPPTILADGTVLTPAARGVYAVRATIGAGRVTAFTRVTPTDHMLAPGGMLARSLSSLPPPKAGLVPLVLDILDPCVPVSLTQIMVGG